MVRGFRGNARLKTGYVFGETTPTRKEDSEFAGQG
jgi:hypothetical protein